MRFQLTNHIEPNRIVVVPTGGEMYSDSGLNRLTGEIALAKTGFTGNAVRPVGYSAKIRSYLIAVVLPEDQDITYEWIRRTYGELIRSVSFDSYQEMIAVIPKISGLDEIRTMECIVEGIRLGSYTFNKYKKTKKKNSGQTEIKVSLLVDRETVGIDFSDSLCRTMAVIDGITLARDLINEPGNMLSPQGFVDRILLEADLAGLSVEVLNEKDLEDQNRIGILSVGKGSARPPRLCILRYASDPSLPLIALIGKGVTTDLGGMNLKIGNDLAAAKTDMGGAAVVVSVMRTLASRKTGCNVCGIVPIVENICDGNALKPGEILSYNNGMTVEIRNADAEGRLILADGLLIANEQKADILIDIATLTGSCVQSLGSKIAGIFGDDRLVEQLIESGRSCGENFWKLPLFEEYSSKLDSDVADISNLAVEEPGVITAALFLKKFAGNSVWAHLDIAGTRNASATYGHIIKGGTGFGVKSLIGFIEKASGVASGPASGGTSAATQQ